MEFNEKLQELRKREGMTQEELASRLYVSRTAISKWESGRGYPSIESLKAISRLFSVSIDELLSSDDILTIAEQDGRQKEKRSVELALALIDICTVLLLFLPFFAQKTGDHIESVSLIALTEAPLYLKILLYIVTCGSVLSGIATLVLRGLQIEAFSRGRVVVSLAMSVASVLIFMLSLKPYAAAFVFSLLIIKALLLIKRK